MTNLEKALSTVLVAVSTGYLARLVLVGKRNKKQTEVFTEEDAPQE